jgi:ABC-type branched-subunit amino acid transport system permease subunit/uncharacterized membrane protein YuzA (DUF378 family)
VSTQPEVALGGPPPDRQALARRVIGTGLVAGIGGIYVGAVGMVNRFDAREVVTGQLTLSYLVYIVISLAAGYMALKPKKSVIAPEARGTGETFAAGAVAGLLSGVVMAAFIVLMDSIDMSGVLVEVNERLFPILTFDRSTGYAALVFIIGGAVLGALGAAMHLLTALVRRALLAGLVGMLLISLMEPLFRVMLDDISENVFLDRLNMEVVLDWIYESGGLSSFAAVLLIVTMALGAALWARRRPVVEIHEAGVPVEEGSLAGIAIAVAVATIFLGAFLQSLFNEIGATGLYQDGELEPPGAVILFVAVTAVTVLWTTKLPARTAAPATGSALQERPKGAGIVGVLLAILGLGLLPQIVGSFPSEIIGVVGLYVLLGLGLNIVVGYAGMLDLGYVAFFAIGAYATGVLTSPASPKYAPELSFWVALPIVVIITTIAGVLIGAPVLRLRGDYLAIVTLGFGEIIRVIVISVWAEPLLGGAGGLLRVPPPNFFGTELREPRNIYYLVLVLVLLVTFLAWRMKDSRMGRAWAAMREDESVAEAMGISIIKTKLLAFALGAAMASFGGAIFAAKIGSIFPVSFQLLVSINVLAIIVLGGMGSIPGVVVGAFVLVGLPEVLREFGEFRLLFYGAIIMAIMILRPEGLVPDVRRRRELHLEAGEEEQFPGAAVAPVAGAP